MYTVYRLVEEGGVVRSGGAVQLFRREAVVELVQKPSQRRQHRLERKLHYKLTFKFICTLKYAQMQYIQYTAIIYIHTYVHTVNPPQCTQPSLHCAVHRFQFCESFRGGF